MRKRYEKNFKMLTEDEMTKLQLSRVCVVGCGGLGGHIIEQLARLGIGHLTVIDGDVFDETNLNRQLLSNVNTLGREKALVAVERIGLVNPEVDIRSFVGRVTPENGTAVLAGHDLIVDAVDNVDTRMLLQEICEDLGIPLVHGAIAGWYGQVATIFPGDRTLSEIYRSRENHGIERALGNPAFTPALVASIQVSECVKVLIGRGELLRKQILYIDLFLHEYVLIPF